MVLHHNLQLLSNTNVKLLLYMPKKYHKLSILSRSKKSNLVLFRVHVLSWSDFVNAHQTPAQSTYLPTYPCSYRANCLHRNSYPSFTAAIPVPAGSSLGKVSKRCFAPSGQAIPHSTPLASSAAIVSRLMLQGTRSSSVPCMMKVGVR